MQDKKNVIIAILAVLVIALGVLLYITNADKGKLADENKGLAAQAENLEGQVSALKDEAAKAAETAKAELDEAVKAKDEAAKAAETAKAELGEAVKAKDEAAQAAETAKAELDEAVKAKDEAEAALQAAREEASGDTRTGASIQDLDLAAVFPSWDPDSAALKELVDFVLASADESNAGYIAPADRIATFDMDGTIISEKAPIYIDSCLTMYRVLDDPTYSASDEERAAMQEMRDRAYTTGENYDPETFTKNDLIASAFAGMTPAEFRAYVADFADNVDVVGFSGMTYGQSFYKPMLEVIDFLRTNGYDVWMVSACEREVVRGIVERLGFPYDHVIATDVVYAASGSNGALADEYNMEQNEQIVLGGPLNEIEVGKSGKPAAIAREIGKRPVLAFGNSSGDFSMLNYAEGNADHPGMGVLVVCDDTVREYGSETKAADFYAKVEAEEWTAFSMANDWLTIYGDGVEKTGLPGAASAEPALPEGVVPVTWEVTPEHPMIDTDEARALYQQILAEDYPTLEELRANLVVQQLDALSAYYKSIYGNTADIDTPERRQLREEIKDWFLTLGSARTESVDENGRHHYVYDGPLNRDFQMELVLGLPASGKSTFVADPDSEAMGAFLLDPDVIKAEIPEYKESHGAAADAIHFEGMGILDQAISEFLTGSMQGVNIVLPIVGGDLEEMLQQYVLPFEAAGYNVKVKFREAKENEAAARVVMRELGGGQLINSAVAFNFGDGPENVYNEIKDMINAKGEPYGYTEEEEEEEEALAPAA